MARALFFAALMGRDFTDPGDAYPRKEIDASEMIEKVRRVARVLMCFDVKVSTP